MNFLQRAQLRSLQKKAKQLYEKRIAGNTTPDIAAEIATQLKLAKFYDKHRFDKELSNTEILAFECYRAAALLGDLEAQYICGKRLLDKGRFWEQFSQGMYGTHVHKKYAEEAYKEGLSYIEAAEEQGYPLAKRLHGLAYLKGWGVEQTPTLGYKLIIDSIEEEKAWERAKEIIQELGLDVTEFFSHLAAYQKKGKSS